MITFCNNKAISNIDSKLFVEIIKSYNVYIKHYEMFASKPKPKKNSRFLKKFTDIQEIKTKDKYIALLYNETDCKGFSPDLVHYNLVLFSDDFSNKNDRAIFINRIFNYIKWSQFL